MTYKNKLAGKSIQKILLKIKFFFIFTEQNLL